MDPVLAARHRIRSLLWWGGGLLAGGALFRLLVLRAPASGSSELEEAAYVALFGTVVAVVGLGLLVVGLGSVAVRLGLTAHGVSATERATTEHLDR